MTQRMQHRVVYWGFWNRQIRISSRSRMTSYGNLTDHERSWRHSQQTLVLRFDGWPVSAKMGRESAIENLLVQDDIIFQLDVQMGNLAQLDAHDAEICFSRKYHIFGSLSWVAHRSSSAADFVRGSSDRKVGRSTRTAAENEQKLQDSQSSRWRIGFKVSWKFANRKETHSQSKQLVHISSECAKCGNCTYWMSASWLRQVRLHRQDATIIRTIRQRLQLIREERSSPRPRNLRRNGDLSFNDWDRLMTLFNWRSRTTVFMPHKKSESVFLAWCVCVFWLFSSGYFVSRLPFTWNKGVWFSLTIHRYLERWVVESRLPRCCVCQPTTMILQLTAFQVSATFVIVSRLLFHV